MEAHWHHITCLFFSLSDTLSVVAICILTRKSYDEHQPRHILPGYCNLHSPATPTSTNSHALHWYQDTLISMNNRHNNISWKLLHFASIVLFRVDTVRGAATQDQLQTNRSWDGPNTSELWIRFTFMFAPHFAENAGITVLIKKKTKNYSP